MASQFDNNKLGHWNNLVEEYADVLGRSENRDLAQSWQNIEKMLRQLEELEDVAADSENPDDAFAAQELLERVESELLQLEQDLEIARGLNWSQFERQLFAEREQSEIEEMQELMNLWSPGTYSSVAQSIIDHAFRKRFDVLDYLRAAFNFDRTKAVRVPPVGFRYDGTARWENQNTGEYIILDDLGKIRSYGIN
ncbi:MAG: hypothetical protein EBE86_011405 [Hormoscilla sp. GUM202]|nr:hypothetical protein [Hormoscilla sp. GUM202]